MLVFLVVFGWPDAERISSGRLLSQCGRVTSMTSGPIPVAVFQAASWMPGTWANCALNMCHSLGAPLPNKCGVTSGSPPSVSQRWFESEVRRLFDDGLHNRAAVGIASLSVVHFPPSAFSVGGGPDPTAYGSSPDHTRAWGLARWGQDPCPEGRSARHLQLPVDCRFCHAPVGDLVHVCPSAHGAVDVACFRVVAALVDFRQNFTLLLPMDVARSCEIGWCIVSTIL